MLKLFSGSKSLALLLAFMLLFTSCGNVTGPSGSNDTSSTSTSSESGSLDGSSVTEDSSDGTASGEDTTVNESTGSTTGTASGKNGVTTSRTTGSSSKSSGVVTTKPTSSNTTKPTTPPTTVGPPLPVTSTLLCYMGNISKTTFMPSVAYMENDVIKDTMYDTFLFLSTQGFASNASNKADWEFYINNIQFASNSNLYALEEAVEETKRALGRSFKVNVILSVYEPNRSATNFGNIDGKNLNLTRLEDRKTAIKWLVDEQVRVFKSKNFRNLNLAGFYWFPEAIEGSTEITAVVPSFTDYVRSIGYFSCWIPFHGAPGLAGGKTAYGFDKVNMQLNYFPGGPAPNNYAYSDYFKNYTFKQTYELNKSLIDSKEFSYEMEYGGKEEKSVTGFKMYMKYGVKYGYMNKYLAYYMGGGPSEVRELYRSTDQYVQSTYGQLHKYIKKSLKESDITLKPTNADLMPVKDW